MQPTRSAETVTDQNLAARIANNDQHAFNQLYDRFSASLLGIITGWVKDTGIAENLLQDVFVRAWSCRQRYDGSKGRLFSWLYRMSRNICIDYYRSRRFRDAKYNVSFESLLNGIADLNSTALTVDAIALRKLVDGLKKEEKEVIDLMYYKGFSQCEIASMLAMPLGTVKTRARRAIRQLHNIFVDDWEKCHAKISLN